MKKSKKSLIIIIIIIITIIAIAGAALAYLYMATDIFKSDKEMFKKYISQNIEELKDIIDLKTVEEYKNLKNENKYESNTSVKLVHSEGGEISNPLNNLSGKINIQKDNEQEYFYVDSQILYEDEKYLQSEIIKEQEVYGARIPEVFEQFLTIENAENIELIATEMGIDAGLLETVMNILNSSDNSNINEQNELIKKEYLNIILSEIENGTFEKQKNEDNNSYSLLLNSEQVKNIILNILNNIKEDISENAEMVQLLDGIIELIKEEEIPAVKITVFEKEQKVNKTVIEIDSHMVKCEFVEKNKEIKITYSNKEKVESYDLKLIKENFDNKEEFQINFCVNGNEDIGLISFSNIMEKTDDTIKLNIELSYKQDIITEAIQMENNITLNKNIEKMETLNSNNSKSLSSLKEERRSEFFDMLKQIVPKTINERIDLIEQKMWNQENEQEDEISQVDINKFNSKFEFYTGDEVSSENVKKLLEVAENHLSGYSSMTINSTEGEETNSKISLTIYIEKDKVDTEKMTEILEKIEDNKKYKILIKYKSENGLIDNIIINEI